MVIRMKREFLLENLRNIREDNDITQQELAKILNVSRANYGRWETKVKIIPLIKLNEFCNYFGVNMDYVVGLSNNRKKMRNDNVIDRKKVGENIRSFRINKKITQEKLAKLLNTTHSTIGAYENGKTLRIIFMFFIIFRI